MQVLRLQEAADKRRFGVHKLRSSWPCQEAKRGSSLGARISFCLHGLSGSYRDVCELHVQLVAGVYI